MGPRQSSNQLLDPQERTKMSFKSKDKLIEDQKCKS